MERLWEPGHYGIAALMLLALLIALVPWPRFAASEHRTHRIRPWAFGMVLAIALLDLSLENGTLGARGLALTRPVFDRDWREVQEWAAAATPKSAKFLTPPEIPGFRVYARRSSVVEWKDGAAMLWDPAFGPGWWERHQAVTAAIASQNPAELHGTARRYGADWLVLPAETAPQELTPVHENRSYKLFAVDGDREP
jgi:hypothetical protein